MSSTTVSNNLNEEPAETTMLSKTAGACAETVSFFANAYPSVSDHELSTPLNKASPIK